MIKRFCEATVLCTICLVFSGCQILGGITTTPPRWVMASVPNHGTLQQIQTRVSLDGIRWSGPSLIPIPSSTAVNTAVPPGVGAHYADGVYVLAYFDTGSLTNTNASRLHFMRSHDGLIWIDDEIYQENGTDVFFNTDFRSQPSVIFDHDLDRWVVTFQSVSSQPLSGEIQVVVLQVPGYTTTQTSADPISAVNMDGSVGMFKHEGEFWIAYRDLFDEVFAFHSIDLQNWQPTSAGQGFRSTDVTAGGGAVGTISGPFVSGGPTGPLIAVTDNGGARIYRTSPGTNRWEQHSVVPNIPNQGINPFSVDATAAVAGIESEVVVARPQQGVPILPGLTGTQVWRNGGNSGILYTDTNRGVSLAYGTNEVSQYDPASHLREYRVTFESIIRTGANQANLNIEEITWVRVEHLDLTGRSYRRVQTNLPSFPAVPIGTGHMYTPPIQLPESQWGLIQVGEVIEVDVEVDGDLYTGTLDYSQVNRNGEADLYLAHTGGNFTYTVHYRTEARDPRSILGN